MNTQTAEQHLTSDEVMKAVVDPSDLDGGQQTHLGACPLCRREVSLYENRLKRIGTIAEMAAPAPSRPFRLSEAKRPWLLREWKPALAMGVAALMLLVIVVWRPTGLLRPDHEREASYNAAADEAFMERIDAIVEDALPESYQRLASIDKTVSTFEMPVDEDLINWVVPSIEEDDDSLS